MQALKAMVEGAGVEEGVSAVALLSGTRDGVVAVVLTSGAVGVPSWSRMIM